MTEKFAFVGYSIISRSHLQLSELHVTQGKGLGSE